LNMPTRLMSSVAGPTCASASPRYELSRPAAHSLSIHTKLSDRTHHLIGAKQLTLLGSAGFLVNTSRGPIVDEGALLDALEKGTIAGAGLCVRAYVSSSGRMSTNGRTQGRL
jgi:hypothetical protein